MTPPPLPPTPPPLPPAVRHAILDAWSVLMPVDCAGCGLADRALCDDCRAALVPDPIRRRLADGTPVIAALPYRGVLRSVLLEYKERNRTDVARALAWALREAVTAARAQLPGAAEAELVPVPTSAAASRRRGYDPVRLLLRRGRLPSSRVLVRFRGGAAQKSLASADRRRNSAGSVRAKRALDGRSFLLVDDVLTTGATLEECARALHAGGGTVVGAAALAFTPLRVGAADGSVEIFRDFDSGGD